MNIIKSGWELKILAILGIFFTIFIAQPVLSPLLLAFFLYLFLNPVVEWLVQFKVPRIIASALIVGLFIGLMSLGITFFIQPASNWIKDAPNNFGIIERKLLFIIQPFKEISRVAEKAQDIAEITKEETVKVTTESQSLGVSIFGFTSNIILGISTVLLFLFFLLIYFKPFIQNIENIIYSRRKTRENILIVHLKNEVSKYLFTFSLICAGLGIVMAIIFWLFGLPNAILWGAMVMLLTFIPYLGHLIGITIIFFVSLITFDSYFHILAPPIVYFLVTILEGQVITPICLGNRLNISPLIVFISMFIWWWLWGIIGVIISVPLLVTIKIIIEHIPSIARYKLLLEE